MRGVKLNNTNTTNEETYLKTGTAEFKLSLTANDATTSSPEMTLKVDGKDWKLTNNEKMKLNKQEINAKLTRGKDKNPYIKLDLTEQKEQAPK
ncbi:MAG: hypothetical protein WCJ39_06350 [bacterium]